MRSLMQPARQMVLRINSLPDRQLGESVGSNCHVGAAHWAPGTR
ncbi:MAG: hypothetical protein AAF460_00215 [Pseudomonadota bacterium]